MKKNKKNEDFHLIKRGPKAADADELKEELLSGKLVIEETATIGSNRGQLFVRIPKSVSQMLQLEKGQKLKFIVSGTRGNYKLQTEAIK